MTQFFHHFFIPSIVWETPKRRRLRLWIPPSNVWWVQSIRALKIIENAFHLNYRNTRDAPNNRVFIVFGLHVCCRSMSTSILTSDANLSFVQKCHLYMVRESVQDPLVSHPSSNIQQQSFLLLTKTHSSLLLQCWFQKAMWSKER